MIPDTVCIPIVATVIMIFIGAALCYVKPRRDQAGFIMNLVSKISEDDDPGEGKACSTKKQY